MNGRNKDKCADKDFDSLKIYFDEQEWKNLSLYMKERFARIKKNYECLQTIGVRVAVPPFMLQKKRTEAATSVQTAAKKTKKASLSHNMKKSANIDVSQFAAPEVMQSASSRHEDKQSAAKKASLSHNMKKSANTDVFQFAAPEVKQSASSRLEDKQSAGASRVPDGFLRRKIVRRKIDWRTLPWDDNHFKPNEKDQDTFEFLTQGVQKNMDTLNSLFQTSDSDSETEPEPGPRGRYPKRNVPKVSYQEEEVSSEDDYIYCDECGRQHDGSCPEHGPLVFVKDKKAPPGPKFAWNTCPDYLSVCRSGIRGAGLGIWTEQDLMKGFVFGPYKGKIVKSRNEAKDSGYAWEIRKSGRIRHYVEGSDTSVSNWMRFVNCAVCEERQNLIAFQFKGQIYYRIYKEIRSFTELLVWYGDEFGAELGIYRSEEEVLLEGQPKTVSFNRKIAPSSSNEKCHNAKKGLIQKNDVFRRQSFRNGKTSSCVPSNEKKYDVPELSENRCRVNNGILLETNPGFDKKYKTRQILEKSITADVESKHTKMTEEKDIVCEFHACSRCDYRTTRASRLRQHIKEVHEGLRPYECQQCDYKAAYRKDLKKHVDAVHEGLRPYECGQCDYKTAHSCNLRQHVGEVHEGRRPHKCPHCDYRASQAVTVRQHINGVHEVRKSYCCETCDYKTAYRTDLRKHVNGVHEGLKPYECRQCDYKTAYRQVLNKHVNAVHEGRRPHKCPHCDYKAAQNSNLRRHLWAVHDKKNVSNTS